MEINNEEGRRRRGRKAKDEVKEVQINEEQTRFFIDLSGEKEKLEFVFDLLRKCNLKNYGKEIIFRDLCLYAISKISEKDIEKIQELSLSEMEKVQRLLDDHNKKSGLTLSLGEFLVKRLGIN